MDIEMLNRFSIHVSQWTIISKIRMVKAEEGTKLLHILKPAIALIPEV